MSTPKPSELPQTPPKRHTHAHTRSRTHSSQSPHPLQPRPINIFSSSNTLTTQTSTSPPFFTTHTRAQSQSQSHNQSQAERKFIDIDGMELGKGTGTGDRRRRRTRTVLGVIEANRYHEVERMGEAPIYTQKKIIAVEGGGDREGDANGADIISDRQVNEEVVGHRARVGQRELRMRDEGPVMKPTHEGDNITSHAGINRSRGGDKENNPASASIKEDSGNFEGTGSGTPRLRTRTRSHTPSASTSTSTSTFNINKHLRISTTPPLNLSSSSTANTTKAGTTSTTLATASILVTPPTPEYSFTHGRGLGLGSGSFGLGARVKQKEGKRDKHKRILGKVGAAVNGETGVRDVRGGAGVRGGDGSGRGWGYGYSTGNGRHEDQSKANKSKELILEYPSTSTSTPGSPAFHSSPSHFSTQTPPTQYPHPYLHREKLTYGRDESSLFARVEDIVGGWKNRLGGVLGGSGGGEQNEEEEEGEVVVPRMDTVGDVGAGSGIGQITKGLSMVGSGGYLVDDAIPSAGASGSSEGKKKIEKVILGKAFIPTPVTSPNPSPSRTNKKLPRARSCSSSDMSLRTSVNSMTETGRFTNFDRKFRPMNVVMGMYRLGFLLTAVWFIGCVLGIGEVGDAAGTGLAVGTGGEAVEGLEVGGGVISVETMQMAGLYSSTSVDTQKQDILESPLSIPAAAVGHPYTAWDLSFQIPVEDLTQVFGLGFSSDCEELGGLGRIGKERSLLTSSNVTILQPHLLSPAMQALSLPSTVQHVSVVSVEQNEPGQLGWLRRLGNSLHQSKSEKAVVRAGTEKQYLGQADVRIPSSQATELVGQNLGHAQRGKYGHRKHSIGTLGRHRDTSAQGRHGPVRYGMDNSI